MARISLGITIVLLLATAFFSFQTKSKIEDLRGQIASLSSQLATTKQQLAKTQADLKTAQSDLADAKAKNDQLTQQVATDKDTIDKANAQVADLTSKLDEANKKLAAGPQTPNSPLQPTGPSQAEFDAMKAKLEDTTHQVAELTTVKETLTNKVKDAESHADELQKVVDHYKNGTIRNGLEGQVLAVNAGWNFVVLSLGDRQGVVANAELLLKRGGKEIGRVRITSVEPSTSVADIVPGTLSRGVRVQPGDRVIFQGAN